jgi:hypothetical protein
MDLRVVFIRNTSEIVGGENKRSSCYSAFCIRSIFQKKLHGFAITIFNIILILRAKLKIQTCHDNTLLREY